MKKKDVYSTAEAAKICGVSTMTIIRSFDSGKLSGFRVPGSRFRRIPHKDLMTFLQQNGIKPMHLEGLEDDTAGRCRILIVEDDADALRFLHTALRRDDQFVLETAENGFEAGYKVASFKPDVVLLDIMLPGIDGVEVCRRIKQGDHPLPKVIAITAVTEKEKVRQMLESGIDDYIPKPYDLREVLKKIHALQPS